LQLPPFLSDENSTDSLQPKPLPAAALAADRVAVAHQKTTALILRHAINPNNHISRDNQQYSRFLFELKYPIFPWQLPKGL